MHPVESTGPWHGVGLPLVQSAVVARRGEIDEGQVGAVKQQVRPPVAAVLGIAAPTRRVAQACRRSSSRLVVGSAAATREQQQRQREQRHRPIMKHKVSVDAQLSAVHPL